MRFLIFLVSLVVISWVLPEMSVVKGQSGRAKTAGLSKPEAIEDGARKPAGPPVVQAWAPKSASVDTVIYVMGYRLYPGEWDKTKAFFIQNGVELPARTAGGSSTTNDLHNGPQSLGVIVPDEARLGPAQIVVEFEGRRSTPATITITEWKLPVIKRLDPASGAPGTLVRVEGEGFHINDELEITDVDSKPIKFISGSPSLFGIPEDIPEGILTVRVGNRKHGKGRYTEPLSFTVTNEPLSVEVLASDSVSVAPGQWLDLQLSNSKPLERSERTEIAFKQGGQTIIVATPKPFRPHVEVPSTLSPGEVELQLRTWRDGRPSQWSEPDSLELADKPVAPLIASIRIGKGSWATSLTPGPDRKTSFTVSPGDDVVLHGLWPVADPSKLRVSLVRSGETVTMTPAEFDEKAYWGSDIKVHLPESLGVGDWRMTVSSETDGTQTEVPIVIRVEKR